MMPKACSAVEPCRIEYDTLPLFWVAATIEAANAILLYRTDMRAPISDTHLHSEVRHEAHELLRSSQSKLRSKNIMPQAEEFSHLVMV